MGDNPNMEQAACRGKTEILFKNGCLRFRCARVFTSFSTLIGMNFMTDLSSQASFRDGLRQWLNLLLAPAMWILSTLPQITDWGRTAKEFSDANDSLLVPYGIAFSIWFPVFVGCIGYAVIQALPKNRLLSIFRDAGWWTAAGFAGVCGWALISTFGNPMMARWGTALIFIPTMLCLVKAMLIFTRRKSELQSINRYWAWLPVSLIAGWTSIAIFLNWTPILVGSFGTSVPDIVPNMIMLVLALVWAVHILRRSGGNVAFAFAIMWGLAWLAYKSLTQIPNVPAIGYAAIVGVATILAALFRQEKSPKP